MHAFDFDFNLEQRALNKAETKYSIKSIRPSACSRSRVASYVLFLSTRFSSLYALLANILECSRRFERCLVLSSVLYVFSYYTFIPFLPVFFLSFQYPTSGCYGEDGDL